MPTVDLAFPIRGTVVPRDHGYPLYSALCRQVPSFHGASWLAVHPLPGTRIEGHALRLRPDAHLSLRLETGRIGDALALAGTTLDLDGATLSLGAPVVNVLRPSAALDARLVLLKLTALPRRAQEGAPDGAFDLDAFAARYLAALRRQLDKLEIASSPVLHGRRRLTVAGRNLLGYSVRVEGLDVRQSLALQQYGLGGKRRMGCGIFRPTRGR